MIKLRPWVALIGKLALTVWESFKISLTISRACGAAKLLKDSKDGCLCPNFSFARWIRCQESLILASLIVPACTALYTASIASIGSGGINSISAPACTALTAMAAALAILVTPPIIRASVTIKPWKPRFWRSFSPRIFEERVAGNSASQAGINRWPDIILSTPDSIAAWKGGNSIASRRWWSWLMMGRSRWESLLVSPWPGKCLAVVKTG